jgi:hypothetical protein
MVNFGSGADPRKDRARAAQAGLGGAAQQEIREA